MVKSVPRGRWLLFLPQLPAKPDYARVKLWRRLQPLGALALRGGVYVLPNSADAREDLEWMGKEVEGDGGSAIVCEAAIVQGITDQELERSFRDRSSAVYQKIAADARAALGDPGARIIARRLRRQLDEESKRDQFGAPHRADAERALNELEAEKGEGRRLEAASAQRHSG
ncbi:MAG TPA: Chromate resistance protein ChrB, partial [Gemmatimonadaceae bacterium]|nr:Chromate resistance protein ChrB [Gemmatimonadaceae bacterium]